MKNTDHCGLLAITCDDPLVGFRLTVMEERIPRQVEIRIMDPSNRIIMVQSVIELSSCERHGKTVFVNFRNQKCQRGSYKFYAGPYPVFAKAVATDSLCAEVTMNWELDADQAILINSSIPNGTGLPEASGKPVLEVTTQVPTVRTQEDWKNLFESCQSRLNQAERAITESALLRESLRSAAGDKETLQLQLDESKAQSGKETSRMSQLTADNMTLTTNNAALTADNARLKQESETYQTTVQKLEEQIATDNDGYNALCQLLKDSNDRVAQG